MNWPELNVAPFHVGGMHCPQIPRQLDNRTACLGARYNLQVQQVRGAEYTRGQQVETIGLPHCLTGSLFQFLF